MLKPKFSLHLAPAKTASKSEPADKSAPEPAPTEAESSSSHRRHTSKDSICDNSPWINRRPLDAQTEHELRTACRLILKNFKPSDHGMENTDPKLDFGGLNRRKESTAQPTEVKVRMPTGAPAELAPPTSSSILRRPSGRTRTRAKADQEIKARTQADLPARANSSRKRADFGWLDERDDRRDDKLRHYGKSPSIDLPRPAAYSNDSDENVALPVAVTSTLANSKVSSSAPTSAPMPADRSVNRRSHQFDDPVAAADAQAAEWMRSELEKARQEEAVNARGRPSIARPPSRAASIKESVKDSVREYIFPGSRSRALSRAQSKDSLRTTDTNDTSLSRKNSGSGWRNWGIPRKLSSRSNSRPGTARHVDESQPRKSESNGLNLNRELPPLPGLDTWKEPEAPKEQKPASPMSPTAETHIASLMRSQEQQPQQSSSTVHKHKKSGSDTLTTQYAAWPARQSSRKKETQALSSPPARTTPSSPSNAEHLATGFSSTSNLDHRLELSSSNHTRHRSGDSNSAANSHNYSRNMSIDTHAQAQAHTPSRSTFSNEPKTPGKEEQKSRLKKIFSGWMHKKDKKEDWMHRMEKEGVKEGVMVQDGTSTSPVVRY